MITPEQMEGLKDQLFEVRCAAEDTREAIADGASTDELAPLIDELVTLTREAERLR